MSPIPTKPDVQLPWKYLALIPIGVFVLGSCIVLLLYSRRFSLQAVEVLSHLRTLLKYPRALFYTCPKAYFSAIARWFQQCLANGQDHMDDYLHPSNAAEHSDESSDDAGIDGPSGGRMDSESKPPEGRGNIGSSGATGAVVNNNHRLSWRGLKSAIRDSNRPGRSLRPRFERARSNNVSIPNNTPPPPYLPPRHVPLSLGSRVSYGLIHNSNRVMENTEIEGVSVDETLPQGVDILRPANEDNIRPRTSGFGPGFWNSYASQRFDSPELATSLLPHNAGRNNLGCHSFGVIPSPGFSDRFERQPLHGASRSPNADRRYSYTTALKRQDSIVGRPNSVEEPKEGSAILGYAKNIPNSYNKDARQFEKAKSRKPSRPQPPLMQQRAPPVPAKISISIHIDDAKATIVDTDIEETSGSESESSMPMPGAWREGK
ncbi:hypothetical protein BCR34DRAFT_237595 [Clohesyomyces aquaticus]|uniref:Uncharacterized protein n=1 Tax=Clohesyomyces aquaticus TaxID=1231657 RepID=A0A1Y1ZWY1_9PLEO|nr:hypothetical protein BCR34DRAFT_237595 [Clohesyomyces aquaticus]